MEKETPDYDDGYQEGWTAGFKAGCSSPGSDGYQGSRFLQRGPVTLGCISEEARDLLDEVMEEWEKHLPNLKKHNGDDYEPGHYGFAYWLIRWSGLVKPTSQEEREAARLT